MALHALVLTWAVPAGCPDQAAFEARLSALLGPQALAEPWSIDTTITRTQGGFAAVVEFRDPQPLTRELRAHGCERLADAIALLIAVRIDVVQVAAAVQPVSSPSVASTPMVPLVPPGPSEATGASPSPMQSPAPRGGVERAERRVPPPDPFVGLEGALGFGPPRQFDGRMALTSGASWARARLEARFEYGPPRTVDYPADGVDGRFQRLGGSVLACRSLRERRLAVHGCGGLSVHAIRGRGQRGLPEPAVGWVPWLAPVLAGRLCLRPGARVGVVFGIEGALAAIRPRFTAGAVGVADLRTAAGSAWITLGVELRFVSRRAGSADMRGSG